MDVIDTSGYVSEFTKRTLEQFDWVQGDPLPANFGALLAEIKERTPPTKNTGLIVDASLMQEADIVAVKDMLAAAKQSVAAAKKRDSVDAATFGLPESVRNVYSQLTSEDSSPQIIDDRATPAAPKQPTDTPEKQPENPQAARAEPTPPPPTAPLNIPEQQPAVEVTCPRCLWDMRQKFEVEITEVDKEAFVAITLGGERFKKAYSFLGDKYSVMFRSLTAVENATVHHQLLLDQKDGDFLSDTEWFLRMFEYRLACSIAEIRVSGKPERPIPELAEVANMALPNNADDRQKTALVRLREYVLNDQLKSEITRRLVSAQFRQFQRLYEALEAMALSPNFW